jgi:hypothetical protein
MSGTAAKEVHPSPLEIEMRGSFSSAAKIICESLIRKFPAGSSNPFVVVFDMLAVLGIPAIETMAVVCAGVIS